MVRGLNRFDPFLRDIQQAARAGHFDRREAEGPSQLERAPIARNVASRHPVDGLLEKVDTMSAERRVQYLASLGYMPRKRATLSGADIKKKVTKWLSKK